MTCATCGQVHPKCKSHKKMTTIPCQFAPERGQDYCKHHGGRLPSVRNASHRRRAEEELHAAVVTYGLRRDVTPQQALLEEVQWTSGHVHWLRGQIQELEHQQIHAGLVATQVKESGTQDGQGGVERVRGGFAEVQRRSEARAHVLVDLYQRERKHLVEVSAVALKLNLEERQVRLAEDQGQLVAGVIRRILGDLELSVEQSERVGEVVPRRLRELLVESGNP